MPFSRPTRRRLVLAACSLPLTPFVHRAIAQQPAAPAASASTTPEPVLGVSMGASRRAVGDYLTARGWTRVIDSTAGVGNPSIFAGTLLGRRAEIIAMFGSATSRDRLINLAMNIPVTSASELRAAYADAYRLIQRGRCDASLSTEYAVQLDSILRGKVPGLRPDDALTHDPLLPDHTTVDTDNNTDWPAPVWANREGAVATRLTAVHLSKRSSWPYQVTLWTSVVLMMENPTMCADTRARVDSAERAQLSARRALVAAAGQSAPLDTIDVLVGPGVTLRVDTLIVHGLESAPDGIERSLIRRRGTSLPYSARLDSGYTSLLVVVADSESAAAGTLVVDGKMVVAAGADPELRGEMKPLFSLMRAELTSKNPLAAFVAVECEIERLNRTYPATADRWIKETEARAFNPEKDRKAMLRLDDALNGHVFGGCAKDRTRYPGTP